ncbi:lipopolysaccharide heptosyl transferase/glycosyl transferase [Gluconobacter frateurii M-2]|nr:lipopolysaccharide heptosyl transferase/glycosyl transferase [Gluconobacter frateurii M-2]
MKILFITSNRLGDAVISTGVLSALQARYPSALFTVVCGPVAAGLFEPDPRCERVITMEKRRHDRHWLDLWRQCVRTRWFLVVDLRGSLLSLTLRTRRRLIVRGGRRDGRKVEQLGQALGRNQAPKPRVWVSDEQERSARALLPDGKWLALGPTANWDGKIWPPERFAALAEGMRAQGLRPVLFYGPGEAEKERAKPVLEALPDALDLGGNRELGEVATLLRRCALFVGNDSGLMHLAAAAGTPTLGLFGPSRMSEYAPSGENAFALSAPGTEGEAALTGLSASEVLDVARAILNGKAEAFRT